MRQYSISLLMGITLLMAGIAVFNWLINPYELFDSPNIDGLNAYKAEADRHTRLGKAYQVDKIRPDVIFLASSRGLVVPEEYFSDEGETALNLALASASTYELLRYFQHANATRPLKKVVLALDESFTSQVQLDFLEERLKVGLDGKLNANKGGTKLRDMMNNLVSLDALKSSLRTIRKQNESPDHLTSEKYMHKRVADAGGHRQMFRKMEASLFAQNLNLEESESGIQSKYYFEKIVEIAYRDDIELIIYFSPIHARYLESLNIMGQWPDIEGMKRFVVQIVGDTARRYNKQVFDVWDFSGYNVITTELVPDFGDVENIMSWYWEGSHYTRETARLIFSRIMRDEDIDNVYQDFGVKLNAENIDIYILNFNKKRKAYNESHLQDKEEVQRIFRSIMSTEDDGGNSENYFKTRNL